MVGREGEVKGQGSGFEGQGSLSDEAMMVQSLVVRKVAEEGRRFRKVRCPEWG